jgi:hypothetical protein
MNSSIKQKQSHTTSWKTSDSKESKAWRERNVDYYSDLSTNYSLEKKAMYGLYKMANGQLDESAYNYIINPLNSDNPKHKQYPAKLRNYDIIGPILSILMGEKIDRPARPIVIAVNSDFESIKLNDIKTRVRGELEQIYINELNKITDTQIDSRVVKSYEELQKESSNSVKDDKAILGDRAIQYISYYNETYRKQRSMFRDYIISRRCFSLRDVYKNNTVYEQLDPLYTNYVCSENTEFVEDGEAASYSMYMTLTDVIDRFHSILSKEQIEELENRMLQGERSSTSENTFFSDSDTLTRELFKNLGYNYRTKNKDTVEVIYVNWKSLMKLGKVTGTDAFGEKYEFEVDEDFKPRKDEKVEWTWVNQLWEGWRIDRDIYADIRPVPHQRGTFDNPSKCKLLINGRVKRGQSIVEKIKPFQERYNGIHWYLEKLMNKNKDKIVIMPNNLIPDNENMDMFDMLYHADADGFLFTEEVDDKKMQMLQAIKVLDLSLSQYIQYIYGFLKEIKLEAEELIGINRQRKGQMSASDGKYVTEESISRSSLSTLEYFIEFEEFEEKDYQALLDLSKFAWKDGKKSYFIDNDSRKALLEVLPYQLQEIEMSVFVKNTAKERQKLEMLKAQAQNFAQNGSRPSIVSKLILNENPSAIMEILEMEEKRMEEMSLQQQEADRNAQIQAEEIKAQNDEKNRAFQYYKTDEDNLRAKEVALIQADVAIGTTEAGINSGKESVADAQMRLKESIEKYYIEKDKLNIQREKIAADERANVRDNKTALKNKVAGEK